MNSKRMLAALLLVLALIAAACGDSGGDAGDDGSEAADDGPAAGGDSSEADGGGAAAGGDLSGEVTILHGFEGEEDIAGLETIIASFNATYPDVEVLQEGAAEFETLARTRISSGSPPDIMLHPQPGLLEDFVDQGIVEPLDFIDPAALESELLGGLVELGTFDDTLYAVPARLSLKSLVWYNQPVFEEEGYEIPETWDDMFALTEQIAADSDLAPWCIGIESGDATGWVATDWIEDILLRTLGAEDYNAWVDGELGFASSEVSGAIEEYMAPIWTNDDFVNGGQENIAREAFGTSVLGIIGGADAECVLHRNATFIEGFIAEQAPEAEFGTDYDFFFLPPISEEVGTPALGAGDYAALYTENEAAMAFIEFLTTPEAGEDWAALGAYLSPFASFDTSVYGSDSLRRAGELLTEADFFAFDGSDLMPGEVGGSSQAGSFWLEITNWVTGNQELQPALENIDEFYATFQ